MVLGIGDIKLIKIEILPLWGLQFREMGEKPCQSMMLNVDKHRSYGTAME